jgi:hypothetical protein
MQTISDRVRLKNMKLSKEGEQVLLTLQREYGMTKEAALRLIGEGGSMFAALVPVGGQPQVEGQDSTTKKQLASLKAQLEGINKLGVER